jgi:hypothetical protein
MFLVHTNWQLAPVVRILLSDLCQTCFEGDLWVIMGVICETACQLIAWDPAAKGQAPLPPID